MGQKPHNITFLTARASIIIGLMSEANKDPVKTIALLKEWNKRGDTEEMACLTPMRSIQIDNAETGSGQLVETSDGSAKDDYNWRYPR